MVSLMIFKKAFDISRSVRGISTVQCYNQGTMTKVKSSVVRLCCYSYSDHCLKVTAF